MKTIEALLILAIFTTAFITSCNKDSVISKESNNNNKSIIRDRGVDPIEAKIIRFIQRMDYVRENPNYPGSENWNYSEDSTIWYIEAALNYNNARDLRNLNNNEVLYQSHIDSAACLIVSDGIGLYGISTIQIVFDNLTDSVLKAFNNIESDNKFFIVDDIIGIVNSQIKMRFVLGEAQSQYSISNWYWGWSLGMCNGSQIGKDAADVMEQTINGPYLPNPIYSHPFDYNTNVETSQRINPTNVPVINNPYGSYMLFEDYQEDILNHHCLNAPEMSKFISYLPQIAANYQPSGKTILFYQVADDTIFGIVPGTGKDFWYMVHYTKITYGIHHTGVIPPPTN